LSIAPTNNSWTTVASSADGSALAAVAASGPVYTSTNSGATWMPNILAVNPEGQWPSVASSADGTKLTVAGSFGPIYTSTNAGATWTTIETTDDERVSVACSADGTKLALMGNDAGIYTSTNSGATWTQTTNLPPPQDSVHSCIVSSADGSKLAAAVYGQGIYTSRDSGATWTAISAPPVNWTSVAISADGSKLVGVAGGYIYEVTGEGPIYTSTNGGATWVSNSVANAGWLCVASSADGTRLVASGMPGIYTSQTTPAPQLNITVASGNLLLSWIVPSINFVLQQNSDLTTTNWTPVTNIPVLNLTNLQNEVSLPQAASNEFYRLQNQ
jgi:photosystem II stability/assembly factor-like uncharacterized protein